MKPESQNQPAFPPELLSSSYEQKVAHFHDKTISHEAIEIAMKRLLEAIEDALPDSLIFIYGPSGVGKSTLLRRAEAKIVERLLPLLEDDLEMVPVARVQLATLGKRGFSWSDTYRRLLDSLNEPLIEHKIIPRSKLPEGGISPYRMSEEKYRISYESALIHRRPQVVMLDDGHHLNKVGAARLLNQLDCLKTIAGQTNVPHALCGTYELLTLRNLSGQLGRRSIDIHFPRYKFDDEGQKHFVAALKTFQAHMPVNDPPDLVSHFDYLMERSAGCIGVLKDWCEWALVRALREGARTVSIEHFEKTTFSNDILAKLLMEISEGEKRLEDSGSSYSLHLKQLREADSGNKAETPANPGEEKQKSKPVHKSKPGQRNPARDPIVDPALCAPKA